MTDLSGQYYYARTYAEHQTNCQKAADVNRSLAAKNESEALVRTENAMVDRLARGAPFGRG